MQQYKEALNERAFSQSTIQAYTFDVSRFLKDNMLEAVDEDNFASLYHKWVAQRTGEVAPGTVYRQAAAVRLYANVVFGLTLDKPVREAPPAKPAQPRDPALPFLRSPDTSNAWRDLANCKEAGPVVMFDASPKGRATAKLLCSDCPSSAPCLDFAIRNNIEWGVWGGYDETERKAIRKEVSVSVGVE